MNETVNQVTGTEAQKNPEQRTFTQDELNAIVEDRLRRASAKFADYEEIKAKADKFDAAEEASKSELTKATEKANALQAKLDQLLKAEDARKLKEKVAKETGVPANLLTGDSEEDMKTQAKAVLEFAGRKTYPAVKDAGEVQQVSGGSNAQLFADWFNETIKK